MKVKSATFYQAIKLGDGNQHNTVYDVAEQSLDVKYKGVEMHFKNGLMMITGKHCDRWKESNKDKVYFVGITNIRGFEVEESELIETPFEAYLEKKAGSDTPTRNEMMDYLRTKGIKFAGNIKNVDLVKLCDGLKP